MDLAFLAFLLYTLADADAPEISGLNVAFAVVNLAILVVNAYISVGTFRQKSAHDAKVLKLDGDEREYRRLDALTQRLEARLVAVEKELADVEGERDTAKKDALGMRRIVRRLLRERESMQAQINRLEAEVTDLRAAQEPAS